MKVRSSTKIALGFIILVALIVGGYRYFSTKAVGHLQFPAVIPGKVNVVGIDPGSGFRVIVANQMAQLVQGEADFKSSESGSEGPTEGAVKKRIPVKEMLGCFQGDPKAIGEFVRIMNEIKQDENWPTNPVLWKSEEIEKALGGDEKLQKKLEHDINMKLDGTPLPSVSLTALYNGILVDFPITLTIHGPDGSRDVTGRMELPYRPKLLRAIDDELATKNADFETIRGTYAAEAKKDMDEPGRRENVRAVLRRLYSAENARGLREAPESVLSKTMVIVNEGHITGAESKEVEVGDKKRYEILVRLTEEGRKRLWKYSLDRVGTHVMLVVDGIAVAAPRISHELTQDELTIGGLEDPVLVREAVDSMNRVVKKG